MARAARGWAQGLSPSRRIVVVSEPQVFSRFGAPILKALHSAGFRAESFLLPAGEKAKSWPQVEKLLRAMLAAGLGRDSGLAALGGGAVTDAAGFAASIYMRGLPWASLPTTLLGQLDSGIGGKTGINLPEGKNLAGTFHQPRVIVCDTSFLATLPERERVSGLAEALKYGLVFEPALWRRITSQWGRLLDGAPAVTAEVIRRAAAWKVKIVARDERETKGARELLNFGHTLGHALESAAGLGTLRHGEAVIWGMRCALRLSLKHAGLSRGAFDLADGFLSTLVVPLPNGLSATQLLAAARRDKKARGGQLRFILLRGIGKPVAVDTVPDSSILAVIKELL